MLVNDEISSLADVENNNDEDFSKKIVKMKFEIWKNRMNYERKKKMFELDFDDVVKVKTMMKSKRNISNDDNEEMEIDDNVDIEMKSIDNDGDDDDEHNEYWNAENDDDDDHHFVDRIPMENHDDHTDDDDDRKRIFDDV